MKKLKCLPLLLVTAASLMGCRSGPLGDDEEDPVSQVDSGLGTIDEVGERAEDDPADFGSDDEVDDT